MIKHQYTAAKFWGIMGSNAANSAKRIIFFYCYKIINIKGGILLCLILKSVGRQKVILINCMRERFILSTVEKA